MKSLHLAVTIEELRLLTSLASDQLFRRQFIDPRIPGYKVCLEDLNLGKALVGRLRLVIDDDKPHISAALTQSPLTKTGKGI